MIYLLIYLQMKTTNIALWTVLLAGLVLSVGGSFAFRAFGGDLEQQTALKDAVEANDYSLIPEDLQDRITQEKFEQMAEHKATHDAVEAAIEAGDYDAFLEVAPEKMLEKIDEDKFNEMIERHAEMEAHQAELEAVVAANDFESFVALMEEHKVEMEARMEENGEMKFGNWERFEEELSEEELTERLQTKFEELVSYYEEHGELPDHGGPMMRWGHKGHGGHRGEKFGWIQE